MLTVDKIEGKIVRVEDKMQFTEINLSLFDGEVKEGDVIVQDSNGRFHTDKAATAERKKEIITLQNSLWE